ncbi:DUF6783 domain-containing protein [Clostridium sp. MCC353]|uniref:DUF6783 domain-containing protein n=1 Tax=Clostridium sp. MCC353 TaxID=2592646 RepID=UPI0031FE6781
MCVTLCGRFGSDEESAAGCVGQIRTNSTAGGAYRWWERIFKHALTAKRSPLPLTICTNSFLQNNL